MEFVLLTAEDLPQVVELEQRCFSDAWSEASLQSAMENPLGCFLAAREGNTVIGYGFIQVVVDEGYLDNIAVAPDHRRQGIGRELLTALLAEANRRDAAFLSLEVRASNQTAIDLYLSQGFRIVGLRQNYCQHPTEHALLMTHYFRDHPTKPAAPETRKESTDETLSH